MLEYLRHVRLDAAMQLIYTYVEGDDLARGAAEEEAKEEACVFISPMHDAHMIIFSLFSSFFPFLLHPNAGKAC